ncbi:MAG: histidyl-tRNA synthetase [Sphingobacteriales bacterium]|jgi:histidyl-tRNA synthetase
MAKVNKPGVPKGTRDFSPEVTGKRQYLFDTIKSAFKKYGFVPIETPSMERLDTLTGKYGDEGDQLIFKVLNSGDYLSKADADDLGNKDSKKLIPQISEKALRYDLTVPFARYVVQHQNELSFPFKRYQIQPVWRADRPQKGRYREFFQCDVDVVGSDSLWYEVEFIELFDEVLTSLGLPGFVIKLNNRKILAGIAEVAGVQDQIIPLTVAIDKLDKIGEEKVKEELAERGFSEEAIKKVSPLFGMQGSNQERLDFLKTYLAESSIGLEGVKEIEWVINQVGDFDGNAELELDLTLARGLNYYTGAIFEVKAKDVEMGSICGGGRYDDLTGIFGLPNVSGVGVSFGADRIFDVMEQLNLFPETTKVGPQVLAVNFSEEDASYSFGVIKSLRKAGISADLYPDSAKMKKQMKHADAIGVTYVLLCGEDERSNGTVTIKNMKTGEQDTIPAKELTSYIA